MGSRIVLLGQRNLYKKENKRDSILGLEISRKGNVMNKNKEGIT